MMKNIEDAQSKHSVLIVGAGLSGYLVAQALRRLSPSIPIRILSADKADFYQKPMLSCALSKQRSLTQLCTGDALTMSEKWQLDIVANDPVIELDRHAQVMTCASGKTWSYTHGILATGSRPCALKLDNNIQSPLWQINHLDHYANFLTAMSERDHVGIVGAGLVGIEFASDLVASGYQVSLIHDHGWPLSQWLPEPMGLYLKDALIDAGICWYGPEMVTAVSKLPTKKLVIDCLSGTRILADIGLSAIGLEANVDLAKQADLDVARGIIINEHGQTSDSHLYALGDCAQVDGWYLPFVAPLRQCANAIAADILGGSSLIHYPPMPIVVKTPACPTVVCPPVPGIKGRWQFEIDNAGLRKYAVAEYCDVDGKLLGFILMGEATKRRAEMLKSIPDWLSFAKTT